MRSASSHRARVDRPPRSRRPERVNITTTRFTRRNSTAGSSSSERVAPQHRRLCSGSVCVCAWHSTSAIAQSSDATQAPAIAIQPTVPTWHWNVDANAFFGFNYQSPQVPRLRCVGIANWLMASGQRSAGTGTLTLSSMLSLEALTLSDLGSPQVFQTGETYHQAPLIDYQHPHDLFMGLGADYRRTTDRATLFGAIEVVGSPSIGPPAFMHRPSASENPQAPLSHHHMDSTHVTPGVVRGGVTAGEWRTEASWFRGREPDENRMDLDLGPLDSFATRLT